MSASHIIQAGKDLFIGKEWGVRHEQEEEREIGAQKEGHVYVLDLFVRVPPRSRTSPWKLTQSIKSQMAESKGNELRSTAANQLSAGRRSERGRQVQAN